VLIYVIRHGQTDWNAERRLQGQKDIPINAIGREQARQNGIALAAILKGKDGEFDFVASPLGRTRETMEIMRSAMGLPPKDYRTDERLVEVSFGDWEGYTLKQLRASQAERVSERNINKWDFIPPGEDAESYEIMSWRTGAWLNSVDRPTVCVTHGGVIRALLRMVEKLPKAEAARVDTPQDRILRLSGGRLEWL
jgi:probable phosphoglycerate mutase